jgi:hypothetical protein
MILNLNIKKQKLKLKMKNIKLKRTELLIQSRNSLSKINKVSLWATLSLPQLFHSLIHCHFRECRNLRIINMRHFHATLSFPHAFGGNPIIIILIDEILITKTSTP